MTSRRTEYYAGEPQRFCECGTPIGPTSERCRRCNCKRLKEAGVVYRGGRKKGTRNKTTISEFRRIVDIIDERDRQQRIASASRGHTFGRDFTISHRRTEYVQ